MVSAGNLLNAGLAAGVYPHEVARARLHDRVVVAQGEDGLGLCRPGLQQEKPAHQKGGERLPQSTPTPAGRASNTLLSLFLKVSHEFEVRHCRLA
jgi:hypothetical protein